MPELSVLKYRINLKIKGKRVKDIDEYFKVEFCNKDFSTNLLLSVLNDVEVNSLSVDFYLNSSIKNARCVDYSWMRLKNVIIQNYYCPKIVELENRCKVVGESTKGCWEINHSRKKHIKWILIDPLLNPTPIINSNNESKFNNSQILLKGEKLKCGLLYTKGFVEEFSRSPIGFVPVLCFTDHADFDTLKSLQKQREVFRLLNLIISKSFFFYDSPVKDQTAFINDNDVLLELQKWESDGHELCYHGMSKYPRKDWESEFVSLKSPENLNKIKCFIDHATLPYNYTRFPDLHRWYDIMYKKGVDIIWNYVDSGDGNVFTINQLNNSSFTIKKTLKSFKLARSIGYKRKKSEILKNIMLYYVPSSLSSHFVNINAILKNAKSGLISQSSIIRFVKNIFAIIFKYFFNPYFIVKFLSGYNKIYKVTKYAPVIFSAINQITTKINVFQTVAIRDFDITFSRKSIENFIKECGLLIAHTYFGTLRDSHKGRFFLDDNYEIRPEVEENFKVISQLISKGKIWNPTISQLKEYFLIVEQIEYEHDIDGDIVIKNDISSKLVKRKI